MDATQSFTRRGFSTRITTVDERIQNVRLVSRPIRIALKSNTTGFISAIYAIF
jgi:hypothetical protein